MKRSISTSFRVHDTFIKKKKQEAKQNTATTTAEHKRGEKKKEISLYTIVSWIRQFKRSSSLLAIHFMQSVVARCALHWNINFNMACYCCQHQRFFFLLLLLLSVAFQPFCFNFCGCRHFFFVPFAALEYDRYHFQMLLSNIFICILVTAQSLVSLVCEYAAVARIWMCDCTFLLCLQYSLLNWDRNGKINFMPLLLLTCCCCHRWC